MSPILWNGTSGALTFPKPLIVSVVTVPTHGKQQRRFPSPMSQQQQQVNTNGNSAAMNGVPMIAGQQMDVNFLYQKVCELSEVLKENRERTQGIISSAEELAVSTHTQLHGCAIQMSTKPSRFHWLIRHLVCRRVLLPMELPLSSRSQCRDIRYVHASSL